VSQAFREALKRVLALRAGCSDHPSDPGAATIFGVTQGTYDCWRAAKRLAVQSVKFTNTTMIEAIPWQR